MNGINVKLCFVKNNRSINANISELLTLKENIENAAKMVGMDNIYIDKVPVVYSKYDEVFVDPLQTVNKLNIYQNCFLYIM